MAEQLLYSFLVDGTEIKDYICNDSKIEHQRENLAGNTATLFVKFDVDSVLTITAGMSIVISRGVDSATEKYVFRGRIKSIISDELFWIITAKDNLNELKFLTFTKSYDKNIDTEAGEYSAIAKDIIENGGFSAEVIDSGTATEDFTADKFISEKKTRLNRLNLISKILDWILYQDYDEDKIKFQPKGYTTFATTLIVGQNILSIPRWEEDIEGMRNEVTIDGVFSLDTREENETGDASTTEFDFTYTPEATDLKVDGVLQKRGVIDSGEEFDYYVDRENLKYVFATAPGSSAVIYMLYQTRIPTPVIADSPTSKALYSITQDEHFSFDDVVTVSDAETRAAQLIQILEFGAVNTNLLTDEYDIKVGDKVSIQDPNKPDKNGEYVVYKKVINYPDPVDSIEIGTSKINISELFQTISERLRSLEVTDTGLVGILLHLIKFARTYLYERRYSYIESRDVSGGFVLDHFEYGILGTSELGDNGATFATVQMVQGNNTYKEFINDTEFEGTGTATWNTTNKEISFTSGQYISTSLITLGVAYTYFTVTLGTVTGDILTEISGDGGTTWQTVTLGVRAAFTTSTIDGVKIRLTENNSSTAKVETIEGTFGELDTPGIKCFLEEN